MIIRRIIQECCHIERISELNKMSPLIVFFLSYSQHVVAVMLLSLLYQCWRSSQVYFGSHACIYKFYIHFAVVANMMQFFIMIKIVFVLKMCSHWWVHGPHACFVLFILGPFVSA